jgi:competence protein ComEC
VIGFYVGLALYLGLLRGRLAGRWCLAALAAWFALGAVTGNDRPAGWPLCPEPRLTCTFVSVGHGACVAVQLPEGQTVLYDAGHMGLPELAGQSIAATLWSQGITHLDAIILSHADTDHYNAIPDLLERFSVGVVYVSPVMFDEETEALQALRAAVEGSGVPLEELYGGDRLQVRGGATLEILHPPRRGILGGDNANSIVLQIEYAGRRILLAGDLESPGLDDVLAEEPTDCDVILAPHHGSLASNPVGFVEWSRPEWVVVSGAASQGIGPVERAYARSEARVFHTAKVGAVQVTIEMGRIAVRDWRGQPW